MKTRTCMGAALLLVLSGCASSPENMDEANASAISYQDFSCDLMAVEAKLIATKMEEFQESGAKKQYRALKRQGKALARSANKKGCPAGTV